MVDDVSAREPENPVRIPRISPKNASGLLDKVVGLGKEIYGTVFDNDRLKRAGQLQQEKGSEKLTALQREAEASQHQAKAEAAERGEKSAQRNKIEA